LHFYRRAETAAGRGEHRGRRQVWAGDSLTVSGQKVSGQKVSGQKVSRQKVSEQKVSGQKSFQTKSFYTKSFRTKSLQTYINPEIMVEIFS
jgi:hypothetical protein